MTQKLIKGLAKKERNKNLVLNSELLIDIINLILRKTCKKECFKNMPNQSSIIHNSIARFAILSMTTDSMSCGVRKKIVVHTSHNVYLSTWSKELLFS